MLRPTPPSRRPLAWSMALVATVLVGAELRAQPRDGGSESAVLALVLRHAVKFGETVVNARSYRLSLGESGFNLSDATSLSLIASIPFTETTTEAWVSPATIEIKERADKLEVVVKAGDRVLTAVGTRTVGAGAAHPDVDLVAKNEAPIAGPDAPLTEAELIAHALKRYGAELKRCGENAKRARWTTDHPKFVACVCPLVSKWLLPKPKETLAYHHGIEKGSNGVTLTINPAGKVEGCRVWVGAKAPPLASAEPRTEPPTPAASPAGDAVAPPKAP